MKRDLGSWLERLEEVQKIHTVAIFGDPQNPDNAGLRSGQQRIEIAMKSIQDSITEIQGYMKGFVRTVVISLITLIVAGFASMVWIGFKQSMNSKSPSSIISP